MINVLSVFLGCGLGGVARWALTRYVAEQFTSIFPWGTVAVNVIGSFLIGLFFVLFNTWMAPPSVRLLATTGFLGGFTTFSTYALETVMLAEKGYGKAAVLNVLTQNGIGCVAVIGGMFAGNLIAYLVKGR
ncbi:MAG: fluoride efflux transporter CrcB [Treponemataceae bacterium]